MAKKRLARFSIPEANEFFCRNGVNIHGQETFIEIYSRAGEDNSNVWFEDLRVELTKDARAISRVTGRYCTKKTIDGKRARYEIDFVGFEGEKVEVVREGHYRLRYR